MGGVGQLCVLMRVPAGCWLRLAGAELRGCSAEGVVSLEVTCGMAADSCCFKSVTVVAFGKVDEVVLVGADVYDVYWMLWDWLKQGAPVISDVFSSGCA